MSVRGHAFITRAGSSNTAPRRGNIHHLHWISRNPFEVRPIHAIVQTRTLVKSHEENNEKPAPAPTAAPPDPTKIDLAFAAYQRGQYVTALREAMNRLDASKTDAPTDAAAKGKQMRFLAARGFSADAIRRVVAGHEED